MKSGFVTNAAVLGFGAMAVAAACARGPVELGFWFEPVAYSSPRIGGPLSPADLTRIESVARSEIGQAFAPFDILLSASRTARHSVRVVQELRDQRFRREMNVAGESRAASGFGGAGAVSFTFIAGGAMVYSPEQANRATVIDAIGKGVGRVAVHEFAHQLLPRTEIHDSRDPQSYDNASATRPEFYFGDLHWDIAGPLLAARLRRR